MDERRSGRNHGPLIEGGAGWLAAHQNADGGWGDTVLSASNLSTTLLCWAALSMIRSGPAKAGHHVPTDPGADVRGVRLQPDHARGVRLQTDHADAIARAEQWLLERERDPELLAVLGRLCAQAELWGKARSFLEASLSFEESRAAHLELARLAERLGQADDAQRHYRRAAELA